MALPAGLISMILQAFLQQGQTGDRSQSVVDPNSQFAPYLSTAGGMFSLGGGYFDENLSKDRRIANMVTGFDPAGIFNSFGSDGGEDSMDPRDLLMYPATSDRIIETLDMLFGSRAQGELEDFLFNPVGVTPGERAEAGFFGTQPVTTDRHRQLRRQGNPRFKPKNSRFMGLVNEADEWFRQFLLPATEEATETGFRTDIDPIVQAEMHRLMTETAPGLAAQFGSAITGSGFQQALGQAGEDLGMFLGAKQVDLDENASNRRLQFIGSGAAQNNFLAPLNLRTSAAQTVGSAGERARTREESTRAGGRLLAAIPGMANAARTLGVIPGTILTGGYNPASGGQDSMSSLAAILPSLIQAGGSLFGGGSGGGNSPTFGSSSPQAFNFNFGGGNPSVFDSPTNTADPFYQNVAFNDSSGFDFFTV